MFKILACVCIEVGSVHNSQSFADTGLMQGGGGNVGMLSARLPAEGRVRERGSWGGGSEPPPPVGTVGSGWSPGKF